ncbi:hypothetical protein QFC21_000010 [Naganishia friedmannii]|uniref:Uncharacterized protein n=1 Tax=Naganishia friedmannii TaxID=89922 RepID=A0ACC2WC29_9TREE|nr:hypothetical protein QFC21_000010 [Naganishia friedmannii]
MTRGRLEAVQTAARGTSTSAAAPSARTASAASEQPHANHHSSSSSFPPAIPPAPVSPLIAQLRQDFRWASISQFMFTFGHAIGVDSHEWDIESLEHDLDSPEEDRVVPAVIVKLLYALTYDRKINIDNFETKLRNQYVLRDPRRNPFGKEEELSRRWNQLGLSEKVQALYNCCEWQWQELARFRALLNAEEDAVEWRIEPCGWDKSGNTYWLFDDNRLWMQKAPPAPPKPIKPFKEAPVKKPSKSKTKVARGKRQAKSVLADEDQEEEQVTSHGLARSRGKATSSTLVDSVEMEDEEEALQGGRSLRKRARTSAAGTTTTRSGRVSKTNGRNGELSSPVSKKAKVSHLVDGASPAPAGRSTRASKRSQVVGDQWEPIPDEWLQSNTASVTAKGKGRRGGKVMRRRSVAGGGDDDSELSDLSDLSMDSASKGKGEESDSDLTSVASSALSEPEDWPSTKAAPGAATVDHDQIECQDEQQDVLDSSTVIASETPGNGETPLTADSAPVDDHQSPMEVDVPIAEAVPMEHSIETLPEKQEDEKVETSADDAQPQLQEGNTMSITLADPAGAAEMKTDDDDAQLSSLATASIELVQQEAVPASGEVLEMAVTAEHEQAPTPDAHNSIETNAGESAVTKVATPPVEDKGDSSASKTVLQELAQEIEEAQEEEEYHDPKDEVMAIIRKAREIDPLEWKLVCSSRYEWEMFPKQFEQSKNPDEKAFYKHLVNNVIPGVRLAYRDKEVRWAKEEAVRNRKRSSRLVVKELERDAQRKAEESARLLEERMQRVRDEEARTQAEEADRISKEKEREERLREREERIREREERIRYRELEDIMAKERAERDREVRVQRRELGLNGSGSRQGSHQLSEPPSRARRGAKDQDEASSETWEVACEICHRQGWNIDEDRPIVACERCERWQHIDCHNRFDKKHGRPVRQWANIEFYCSDCSRKLAEERNTKQDPSGALNEGPVSLDASHSPLAHITTRTQPSYNDTLASSPVHKSPRITIPAYAHGKSPVLMKAQPQLLSSAVAGQTPAQQPVQTAPLRTSAPQQIVTLPLASAYSASELVNGTSSSTVSGSTPATVTPMLAEKALSFDLPMHTMPSAQHLASQSTTLLIQPAVQQPLPSTPYRAYSVETRQEPPNGAASTVSPADGGASHPMVASDNDRIPLA